MRASFSAMLLAASLTSSHAAFAQYKSSAQIGYELTHPNPLAEGRLAPVATSGAVRKPSDLLHRNPEDRPTLSLGADAPGGGQPNGSSTVLGCEQYRPAYASILAMGFGTNSPVLTQQAKTQLDILARELTIPPYSTMRIRIEGHADTTGGDAVNDNISLGRAQAAVDYLSDKVDVSRIKAVGEGKHDLVKPTGEDVNEPCNRGILVVNLDQPR